MKMNNRLMLTMIFCMGFSVGILARQSAPEVASKNPSYQSSEPQGLSTGNKKFSVGIRFFPLECGISLGSLSDGAKMSDIVALQLPLWLDVCYAFNPRFLAGVYVQWAGAVITDMSECSNTRFGVQSQYHLGASGAVDPWLGLGIGYDILSGNDRIPSFSDVDEIAEFTYSGMEFANLQIGLDFRAWSICGLGPYASWSLGQYSGYSTADPMSGKKTGSIEKKAMHQWLTLGLHLAIKL
jgi:hypothetical protein